MKNNLSWDLEPKWQRYDQLFNRRPVNRTGYKEHVNGSMKAKAIRQQEHGKQQQEHINTKEQKVGGNT